MNNNVTGARVMPSSPDALSRNLPLKFTRLLNAATLNEPGRLACVIANERYPLIDGIPILLKEHRRYLHRLNRFLGTQLQKLEAFREHPADRFWAEPQSLELQKRMIAVRAGLQSDLASDPDASNAPLTSKYDGEANTDIYTRIAWGHLSVCAGRDATVFPDAGELYTKLATLVGSWLPPNGVFLDLGCGVGRTVVDAARPARFRKVPPYFGILFAHKRGLLKPRSKVRTALTPHSLSATRPMCYYRIDPSIAYF